MDIYEVKRSQRHLSAAIENNWSEGPIPKSYVKEIENWFCRTLDKIICIDFVVRNIEMEASLI